LHARVRLCPIIRSLPVSRAEFAVQQGRGHRQPKSFGGEGEEAGLEVVHLRAFLAEVHRKWRATMTKITAIGFGERNQHGWKEFRMGTQLARAEDGG
jgi:hypothetical protein